MLEGPVVVQAPVTERQVVESLPHIVQRRLPMAARCQCNVTENYYFTRLFFDW